MIKFLPNKTKLFFLIAAVFFVAMLPSYSFASGGGLRKDSIKTCPNGITYGEHSDGHGGTHWHVAITNGKNYYASGDAMANDPCPDSKKNEGTAGSTSGGTSNNVAPSANSPSSYAPSDDTSLSSVYVDYNKVDIADEMHATVSKAEASISINTNNKNATVSFENRPLEIGDNQFEITVTAQNGSIKTYILIINRQYKQGEASLVDFKIGSNSVAFIDSEASVSIAAGSTHIDYSYTLSDSEAQLVIYHDDKIVQNFDDLESSAQYKLSVIDIDGNEKNYILNISRMSDAETAATYSVGGIMLLGAPIAGAAFALKAKRNKK